MVDTGATADGFLDNTFAQERNIPLTKLEKPLRLTVVDGRDSSAGAITHCADVDLRIGSHLEHIKLYVTKLGRYDIILGHPWLRRHSGHPDFADGYIRFNSTYCRNNCLPSNIHQEVVRTTGPVPSLPPSPQRGSPRRVNAAAFDVLSRQHGVQIFSASVGEIDALLTSFGKEVSICECGLAIEGDREDPTTTSNKASADSNTKTDLDWKERLDRAAKFVCSVDLSQVTTEDIRKALAPTTHEDPKLKVPQYLHPLIRAWDHRETEKLPPHRACDHKIELFPGKLPPAGPLYNMSEDELLVLRKFLDENLAKGFIRASKSPAASPVLFAKKPGGGLRFCVDYRALNAITIRNRYPLPLVQETLARLSKAKVYTKLDIVAAFNRIRIAEGQEYLTAFNTRYGLYESLVMPFGLSNAPATFQARINEVLHPYLDVFCTAYIDDILIYSDDLVSHRKQVRLVVQALIDAGLQLDVKKCEFEVTEVTYLGMIISTNGVRMDPAKVKAITNWEPASNLKDVQAFLGFANFYRRFIKGFSKIVRPLVALTRKGIKFLWSPACQKAFQTLKNAFNSAPALSHFDPLREIFVETDASDFVSSGVLSQKDDQGVLHPVAFMSRKYNPAECNYEIYDKELLAIVRCFEGWRSELQGAHFPIHVLTDHRNLEYFMTTKQLTRRQVRWSEFLAQFDFIIRYRPGPQGTKPDALTRRSQDLPSSKDDPRTTYQTHALLKRTNLDAHIKDELHVAPAVVEQEIEPTDHKISRLLDAGYAVDKFWKKIKAEMTKPEGIPHSKEIPLSECEIIDNRLVFRDRIYVPEGELRLLLTQLAHDSCESGHPGKNKLYTLLNRYYWWPRMSSDTSAYALHCHDCRRNNVNRSRYQGTLKPLPLPLARWKDISVDFIGPLPKDEGPLSHLKWHNSEGFSMIMVIVDRLTKMRHYIPCRENMSTKDQAFLFIRDVWKLHGLPESIVSDRGTTFVNAFWNAVCSQLKINVALSTAYHPESDGQTEIANAFLEQYLRQYVNFAQDDWVKWLPLAEFAANNATSSSTNMSPFFANYAFHPRMSFGLPRPLATGSSQHVRNQHRDGVKFVQKMNDIFDILYENLSTTKDSQEKHANANRQPHPAYRPGDEVYLDAKNISSARPTKKLDKKFYGPYQIEKVLDSHSYQLKLPYEFGKTHRTFHPSLLLPANQPGLPGQVDPPAPPISINENGELLWAIEAILNTRRTKKKGFEYLILWRGYDASEQSWEPLRNVVNARGSISEFQRRFPKAARPTKDEIQRAKQESLASLG